MFEKEAEEYANGKGHEHYNYLFEECTGSPSTFANWCFKDGAEFGYNKSNEWHYMKDGDLPEVDNRIVLCICGNGYIDGKSNYKLRLLTRKEFPLFQPVYTWKEIILPKEIEQ